MKEWNCREGKELIVGCCEEVGKVSPAGRFIQISIGSGGRCTTRGKGKQTTDLLNFSGECGPVRNEMFLCVSNGFSEFGRGLRADQLDILLKAKHELELTLRIVRMWILRRFLE